LDSVQLGRYVGYVPQDVELFAGSVRENIARMGPVDDEAVVEAASLAHAHEMIQRLPDGYETQIGDSGLRLSGGQRQRIGLARAVYGDPRLVVLDEPNANLDQAGESALSTAIQDLKKRGVALIIVGHRPSTLAQADKIVLLRDGHVECLDRVM
jgi:ATP-binding cassette subfamily C protein/ATP-binding cassette subfamily C exporter for protease/lipase/ATP-binding cassette subfamily C protein EexD